MKTTTPKWIGRNIRPGMTRGGFAPGCSFLTDLPPAKPREECRWRQHDDIIEAANRVLEKRMPSVVAESYIQSHAP